MNDNNNGILHEEFAADDVDRILKLNAMINSPDKVVSGTARILKEAGPAFERVMLEILKEDGSLAIPIFAQVVTNFLINGLVLKVQPEVMMDVVNAAESMIHQSIAISVKNLPRVLTEFQKMDSADDETQN